jgi:hypothetical protein
VVEAEEQVFVDQEHQDRVELEEVEQVLLLIQIMQFQEQLIQVEVEAELLDVLVQELAVPADRESLY